MANMSFELRRRVAAVLDDNVAVTQVGGVLQIAIIGEAQIAVLHKMIDGYLNCRPEAPQWLFQLSDVLNPVPVPERI